MTFSPRSSKTWTQCLFATSSTWCQACTPAPTPSRYTHTHTALYHLKHTMIFSRLLYYMLVCLPPSSDVVPGLHADQGSVEQRPGSQSPALQAELLRLPAQHQHPHGQQERSVRMHVRQINTDEPRMSEMHSRCFCFWLTKGKIVIHGENVVKQQCKNIKFTNVLQDQNVAVC